jgi:hypothetical protein
MGKGSSFLLISTLLFVLSCSDNRNSKEKENGKTKDEAAYEVKSSRKDHNFKREAIQFNAEVKDRLKDIEIKLTDLKLRYENKSSDKNENFKAELDRLKKKSEELKTKIDFSGDSAKEKLSLLKKDLNSGIEDIERRMEKKYGKYVTADSSKKDN